VSVLIVVISHQKTEKKRWKRKKTKLHLTNSCVCRDSLILYVSIQHYLKEEQKELSVFPDIESQIILRKKLHG
jgi:hypothetical protein